MKIFKNIENKLSNNEMITDEDIASLQVIVYTDYEESQLEILLKAHGLIERISENLKMDINEKYAIIYLLQVLSANMLSEKEHEIYMEETSMRIDPKERYFIKKGKLEMALKLLEDGHTIEYVSKLSGIPKKDILNAK